MNEFFTQIYSLITSETGALTYQLILAFSVTGALLSALGHWRRSEIRQLRRMLVGLSLLLALRIIIFIIAGLAWQDLIRYEQLLPVLDQWVTLLSLVLIIWLWAFPEPNRYADAATVLVALLVITLGV